MSKFILIITKRAFMICYIFFTNLVYKKLYMEFDTFIIHVLYLINVTILTFLPVLNRIKKITPFSSNLIILKSFLPSLHGFHSIY